MKLKLSALSLALLPALASASVALQTDERGAYRTDSLLVVYKQGVSLSEKRSVRNLVLARIKDRDSDEIDDNYRHLMQGRLAKYAIGNLSVKQALQKLRNHPAVEYAEPDYIRYASVIPDDPDFSQLWGLHNTGQTGGVADADIDAPEAWDISTGSKDIIVGVIDTGVDHSHPDLNDNIWINPGEIPDNGVDDDGNGYIDDVHGINAITDVGDPMDDEGHGSHVSGTIGATGNNGVGVVGVNHQVSIAGCKFLSAAGTGSTSDAIKCIDYMVGLRQAGNNIRILNNSWGGGGFSQALSDAIDGSEAADILFVAAAGNDAVDNDVNPSYPSNYEHESVLAVASTNASDEMSWFSQWGLTSVDMGAPGSAIVSTLPGGGYGSASGTSMAAPHVAGAAALVLSVNPDLNAVELKQLLMDSGDDNAALTGKTVSGKRLNAFRALEDADPQPGFRISVSPVNTSIEAGETATYDFTLTSVAEWDGVVSLALDSDLAAASLSTDTAMPGDSFSLSVPTEADTAWGDYSFTVTGTSGELEKSQTVGLNVYPQGLTEFTYSNDDAVDIPDNDPAGISSVINVADPITLFGTSAYVNISHTWIGDLIVTLTSPAGTTATLHNQAGGSADNIDQSFSTDAFNGEIATGDWTLHVEDTVAADTGTLNNWSVTFTGLGDVAPAAPEAGFDVVTDFLTASFTDTSSDVNNDISSWSWDFGDGNSSTEQNPVHSYDAGGNYEVSLTVTDSEGMSDTQSKTVTVSDVAISLEVKRAYKTRLGNLRVDLVFSGTPAETVDVYRNGVKIDTVDNLGIYRDRERRVEGNDFVYQICDASGACSDEVSVNF